jgi:hypothetical protein
LGHLVRLCFCVQSEAQGTRKNEVVLLDWLYSE